MSHDFCRKGDCRHVSVVLDLPDPTVVHNFYIPAGGDEPDPGINDKFAHKLAFLDELQSWTQSKARPGGHEAILVGDLEYCSAHGGCVVPQGPAEGGEPYANRDRSPVGHSASRWLAGCDAQDVPPDQKLYTWWSYRAKDWQAANRGRRLDHVWASEGIANRSTGITVHKDARGLAATLRSRAGYCALFSLSVSEVGASALSPASREFGRIP